MNSLSEGPSLQRYAARFSAVEINSSFYRPHRPSTYARWADTVPSTFKFAVKIPKAITHVKRLVDVGNAPSRSLWLRFVASAKSWVACSCSCHRRSDIQLPQTHFSSALRRHFAGAVVLEPRNHEWFTPRVEGMLAANGISRAAADPGIQASACEPGGWTGLAYYRLHGWPQVYFSSYSRGIYSFAGENSFTLMPLREP